MGNKTARPLVKVRSIRVKEKRQMITNVDEKDVPSYAFEMAKSGVQIYINPQKPGEVTGYQLYVKAYRDANPYVELKTVKHIWKYLPRMTKNKWIDQALKTPNVYTGFGYFMKYNKRQLKRRYPNWPIQQIIQQIWIDWKALPFEIKNQWDQKAKQPFTNQNECSRIHFDFQKLHQNNLLPK